MEDFRKVTGEEENVLTVIKLIGQMGEIELSTNDINISFYDEIYNLLIKND